MASQTDNLLKASNCYSLPVNVEQVAKHLEIAILYEELEDSMSGVLMIKDGRKAICVNKLHHSNRQRFTIAHEIGHFVLHHRRSNNDVHLDKKWAYFRAADAGIEEEEVQANRFAAELLMPKELLAREITSTALDFSNDIDVDGLAEKLKVSAQALTIRLVKLGLIAPY